MRDKICTLANHLQQIHSSNKKRITANTVMRVTIKLVLDKFKAGVRESTANNEKELFELVKKQLCGVKKKKNMQNRGARRIS